MASRGLGTLTIDLIAKTFGFEQGMDKAAKTADKRMKEIEASAKKAGAFIGTAIGAGVVAAGAALTKLTVDAINYADALDEMSARTQISTEQLSKWGYAAKLSGTDLESLVSSTDKLAKNLAAAADGDSKMGKLFETLGISVKDADGNLRSVEAILPEIADRFAALDNQTTETALAMQLFGKSGAELLEFLNRGGDGIAALGTELESLGGVISGETAAAAAQFKDELDRLKVTGTALGTQIAAQLLPALLDTTKEFRQLVQDGNLAANVVGVIEGAMAAGISVINAYNIAVERTSLLFEAQAKSAKGAIEAYKNFATLGLADGSVVGGLNQMIQAPLDATAEAKRLQAAREAEARKVNVTLIDPGEGLEAWKQEKVLAAEAAALQERLNKLLEGSAESTKKATGAKKEKNEVDREALELQRELAREAEEEADMYRESLRLVEDNIARGKEVADGLEFEVKLLGLSNREREKAIALSQLSNEALLGEGERIKKNIDTLYDEMERVELMDGFRDSFQNFFTDVISGTESVSDAFKNMLDDINAMILRRITENWVEQLFGAFGSNQGGAAGGNWFSTIAGWFAGGKASGGIAHANRLYEVNESGMEMASVNGRDYLLTGSKPVQITPNSGMGGFQQVVNFTVQGKIDRRTEDQVAQKAGRTMQMAMARNG
jgi:hypothetical protein